MIVKKQYIHWLKREPKKAAPPVFPDIIVTSCREKNLPQFLLFARLLNRTSQKQKKKWINQKYEFKQ